MELQYCCQETIGTLMYHTTPADSPVLVAVEEPQPIGKLTQLNVPNFQAQSLILQLREQ